MNDFISTVVLEPLAPFDFERPLAAFYATHAARTAAVPSSIGRALLGGLHADRVAFAFAAGYRAALCALVPSRVGPDVRATLCVTESGGNHPRAIETTLTETDEGLLLQGQKAFCTLADDATLLLIAAREGERDGRPSIRLVCVSPAQIGVVIEPLAPLRFVPEASHALLALNTRVDPAQVLEGDGYTRYVKPFRTVEDLHVMAALSAFAWGASRRWLTAETQALELLASITTLGDLAGRDPSDAVTHLALAGVLSTLPLALTRVVEAIESHRAGSPDAMSFCERFRRDLALLKIGDQARQQRTLSALSRLRSGG
ncbi:MAG: acyl-CoA dehydrogenase [Deltaproteobacteria bacterium]|nr:acyl-CoA dehydrogenase [Deltaproteobacteria bacterium]